FGELVFSATSLSQKESQASGASAAVATDGRVSDTPAGIGGASGGIAMPYFITNYNYVYTGDNFNVNSDGLVYKRKMDNSLSINLVKAIRGMNLGLDLNKLSNLKINSLEISEDKQFGYSLYFDLRGNIFSINLNWEKWPTQENYSPNSQMPTDEEIVAIADKFFEDYGIDISRYGKGQVIQNQGGIMYSKAESSVSTNSSTVQPDSSMERPYTAYASVVYPLQINGQTVYDQSGQVYGLTVGIDLGYNRVTSAYNINAGNFASSKYEIETDPQELIKIAEKGGLSYGNYYSPEAQENIDVELETPKQGLVMMWRAEEGDSFGTELFVPALIFPVKPTTDQSYFYRNNIVVPLVGEMMNNNDGGIPVPL
ncbi:MAG: hypothetical protein Q8N55_02530, partial [bacterium]|nr:hypothetical protein [bacterium]